MKYWTIKQAAQMVGLSPITVRWHINQGNIKAKKLEGGRDWLLSESAIEKLKEQKKSKGDK